MTEYNRTELGKKAKERGFVIRTGTAEVQQMATKIKHRTNIRFGSVLFLYSDMIAGEAFFLKLVYWAYPK